MDDDGQPFRVRVDAVSIHNDTYVDGPDSVTVSPVVDRAVSDGLVSAYEVVEALNISWNAAREGDAYVAEGSSFNILSPDMTWITANFEVPPEVRTLAENDGEFMRGMVETMSSAVELGRSQRTASIGGVLSQAAAGSGSVGTRAIGPAVAEATVDSRSVGAGR